MLKISVFCHSCKKKLDTDVDYSAAIPRWAMNLREIALQHGWVADGHTAFCTDCKQEVAYKSDIFYPLYKLRMVGLIQCDVCGLQQLWRKVVLEEQFARKIRRDFKQKGWKFVFESPGKNTKKDYCPSCEPAYWAQERLELVNLVWSMSTQAAAAELGVSDKALEKRCKRLGISKPPRGFWAKFYAGYVQECEEMIPPDVTKILGESHLPKIHTIESAS